MKVMYEPYEKVRRCSMYPGSEYLEVGGIETKSRVIREM